MSNTAAKNSTRAGGSAGSSSSVPREQKSEGGKRIGRQPASRTSLSPGQKRKNGARDISSGDNGSGGSMMQKRTRSRRSARDLTRSYVCTEHDCDRRYQEFRSLQAHLAAKHDIHVSLRRQGKSAHRGSSSNRSPSSPQPSLLLLEPKPISKIPSPLDLVWGWSLGNTHHPRALLPKPRAKVPLQRVAQISPGRASQFSVSIPPLHPSPQPQYQSIRFSAPPSAQSLFQAAVPDPYEHKFSQSWETTLNQSDAMEVDSEVTPEEGVLDDVDGIIDLALWSECGEMWMEGVSHSEIRNAAMKFEITVQSPITTIVGSPQAQPKPTRFDHQPAVPKQLAKFADQTWGDGHLAEPALEFPHASYSEPVQDAAFSPLPELTLSEPEIIADQESESGVWPDLPEVRPIGYGYFTGREDYWLNLPDQRKSIEGDSGMPPLPHPPAPAETRTPY